MIKKYNPYTVQNTNKTLSQVTLETVIGLTNRRFQERQETKEVSMYSSEHLFKLAKMRRDEILRETEINSRPRSARSPSPQKISLRVAWALVGPAFAVILLSLII
jgi:hypothetical protein